MVSFFYIFLIHWGQFPCQPLSVPVSLKIALRGSKGFSVRYIPGLLSTTVKP